MSSETNEVPVEFEEPSTVLRMRGLPFAAGYDEIRKFFEGYPLQNIWICKKKGHSTGQAYVQFKTIELASAALQALDKNFMGTRYIELFPSTEAEMNHAKGASLNKYKGYVVRLRGLPYNASCEDIKDFFKPIEVAKGELGITFTFTSEQRPTGEAYVEFPSAEHQKEAMKKNKQTLGKRYIELFLTSKVEMIQAAQQHGLLLGVKTGPSAVPQAQLPLLSPVMYDTHLYPEPKMGSNISNIIDMLQGLQMSAPATPLPRQPVTALDLFATPGGYRLHNQLSLPNQMYQTQSASAYMPTMISSASMAASLESTMAAFSQSAASVGIRPHPQYEVVTNPMMQGSVYPNAVPMLSPDNGQAAQYLPNLLATMRLQQQQRQYKAVY